MTFTDKLREEIARTIKETNVCGLSLPSREWVFCDDPRLGDEIRDDTCECKTIADAIVSGPIAELVQERDEAVKDRDRLIAANRTLRERR